jgi:hypothetical protein
MYSAYYNTQSAGFATKHLKKVQSMVYYKKVADMNAAGLEGFDPK